MVNIDILRKRSAARKLASEKLQAANLVAVWESAIQWEREHNPTIDPEYIDYLLNDVLPDLRVLLKHEETLSRSEVETHLQAEWKKIDLLEEMIEKPEEGELVTTPISRRLIQKIVEAANTGLSQPIVLGHPLVFKPFGN